MPVGGTRQNQLVTVFVGLIPLGVFDTYSGGDTTAPSTKHRPGGMGKQIPYATLPVYSDLTVSRVLEWDRDQPLIKTLRPLAGVIRGGVVVQPLDADGNAYGASTTYEGQFLGIKGISGDSESEAISMFDLDFSVVDVV